MIKMTAKRKMKITQVWCNISPIFLGCCLTRLSTHYIGHAKIQECLPSCGPWLCAWPTVYCPRGISRALA
jgi:hypothetical protein